MPSRIRTFSLLNNVESSYKEGISAQGEAAYWRDRLAEHKSQLERQQSSSVSSSRGGNSSSGWRTPQRDITARATGWSPYQLVDDHGRVALHNQRSSGGYASSTSRLSQPIGPPSTPSTTTALPAQRRVLPADYSRASQEITRVHYREPQVQGRQQKTTRPPVDEYKDAMIGLTSDVKRSEHILQAGSRGKARREDVNAKPLKLG